MTTLKALTLFAVLSGTFRADARDLAPAQPYIIGENVVRFLEAGKIEVLNGEEHTPAPEMCNLILSGPRGATFAKMELQLSDLDDDVRLMGFFDLDRVSTTPFPLREMTPKATHSSQGASDLLYDGQTLISYHEKIQFDKIIDDEIMHKITVITDPELNHVETIDIDVKKHKNLIVPILKAKKPLSPNWNLSKIRCSEFRRVK